MSDPCAFDSLLYTATHQCWDEDHNDLHIGICQGCDKAKILKHWIHYHKLSPVDGMLCWNFMKAFPSALEQSTRIVPKERVSKILSLMKKVGAFGSTDRWTCVQTSKIKKRYDRPNPVTIYWKQEMEGWEILSREEITSEEYSSSNHINLE